MEVQSIASLWLDAFCDDIQERLGWWPCISTYKYSDRCLVDGEPSLDQKTLKIGNSLFQTLLIDKFLHFRLNIFLEHIAFKVSYFDSIIFLFVVTGRDDDS